MMDGAYFVGKRQLLDFFNNLLDLNLTRIEQTAPGHIACQITDLIFPGSIPLNRINWEAKSDYEYVQNYKLLQAAFTKHRVQRHVDVDKLIRAKYQDNLEFCQWLKAFYDQAAAGAEDGYDPVAVRNKGKGGRKYNQQMNSGKGRNGTYTKSAAPPAVDRASRPLRERATPSNNANKVTSKVSVAKQAELEQANEELTQKVQELELSIEDIEKERDQIVMDVEKERDFYFSKLRSIEVMLQVYQEKAPEEQEDFSVLSDKVFQILYAAAEDNLTVNAEGQVVEAAEEELEELLVDNV